MTACIYSRMFRAFSGCCWFLTSQRMELLDDSKTFAARDFHSSPHQQKNNTSSTPTMSQAPFIQMEPLLSSAKGIYHGLKQDQGLCDKWFSGLKKFWTWRYHFLNICALKVSLPLCSQSVLTHNMFPLQQFYWSLHCRSFSKKPSSLPTIGAPHKEGSGLGALMNHLHSGSDPLSNVDISSIQINNLLPFNMNISNACWNPHLEKTILIHSGHWVQMFRWSWFPTQSSLCQGASNWHLQALAFQYHRGRLHGPNLMGPSEEFAKRMVTSALIMVTNVIIMVTNVIIVVTNVKIMPNVKIFQTYFNQLLNWHPSGTQLPSPPKELSLLPGAIRQERHPTWSPSNSSLATSSPPMQLPSFTKVPPHSLQTLSVRIAATHSASMGCFEWLPMRIHSSPHCNGVQVSSPSLAEMLAQSVEIQASLRSKLKCGTCNASSSCKACTPNSAKWSSQCSYSLRRVSKELCPKLQVIIFQQCEASVLLGGNFKHLFPFKVYQDLHGPPKRPLLQGWPHQSGWRCLAQSGLSNVKYFISWWLLSNGNLAVSISVLQHATVFFCGFLTLSQNDPKSNSRTP